MKTIPLASFIAAAAAAAFAPGLRADAAADYGQNCASCHGKDGAGHTKAGKLTHVKDLTDAAYQKSFTDDQAFGDMKNGLKKDGHDAMKPLAGKLTDDQLKALVGYVRTLAK